MHGITLPKLLLVGSLFAAAAVAQAPHTVVVELFTAQGCSSCPPADRLLAALGRDPSLHVVPLAYHVDSWNTQGWIDPFAKPEWTRRHQFYGRVLEAREIYTPQAVVDGRTELLGSDESALRVAVERAAVEPAAALALTLRPARSAVAIEVEVGVPESLGQRRLDVMVAVYETGLVTRVARGENGGKTLYDEYVVRTLKRAKRLDGAGPARVTLELPLGEDWQRANLGVAAFVQDARSLSIHGAASAPLPSVAPAGP